MVSTVVMYECSICKKQYVKEERANQCQERCTRIQSFNEKYPEVKDKHLDFANGGGWVQRKEEWYKNFEKDFVEIVRINHPTIDTKYLEYPRGFLGRILNDENYDEYTIWGRLLAICSECFREWGQAYYADHCLHNGNYKKYGSPEKVKEWRE